MRLADKNIDMLNGPFAKKILPFSEWCGFAPSFAASPAHRTLYRAFPLSWLVTIALVGLCFIFVRPFASGSKKQ